MQTSSSENEQLTDWVSQSSRNEEIFKEIKEIWEHSKVREADATTLAALERFKTKTNAEPVTRKIPTLWWYSAAAILIAIFGIFTLSGLMQEKPLQYVTIKTHTGEIKNLKLSDGTTIHLAPQSSLKYPVAFGSKQRKVSLQGEAYFEVSKNKDKPFVVQSGTVMVKVLGTAFNVSSNETQPDIEVSLISGKVELSTADEPESRYLLSPGQRLVYNKKEARFYRNAFDTSEVTGWMTHNLSFRNESLLAAAQKIERMYGVKIVFEDQEITRSNLFATFKNKPLKYILETIKVAANIHYYQEGKIIYLSHNQTNEQP